MSHSRSRPPVRGGRGAALPAMAGGTEGDGPSTIPPSRFRLPQPEPAPGGSTRSVSRDSRAGAVPAGRVRAALGRGPYPDTDRTVGVGFAGEAAGLSAGRPGGAKAEHRGPGDQPPLPFHG